MSGVLIGLDVGTTSAKAVVTTVQGEVLATGREPIVWSRSRFGVESDASHILAAALAATSHALHICERAEVLALAVASMGESSVLLDSYGEPVAPVIAWHDTRDSRQVRELGEDVGESEFTATTGLPFRGQWSLTKHRWQMVHDPTARTAVTRLGIAEWIIRALGGDEVSEQSLASRTGWLRLHDRTWFDEALDWSKLPARALPELVEGGAPAGRVLVSRGVTALEGATLTVAGHDHQAAAVGAAATRLGAVLDSCGTAEAVVRTIAPGLDRQAVSALGRAGITCGWHALPGHWCLLGGTQGGLAMQRVLRMLGLEDTDIPRLDATEPSGSTVEVDGVDEEHLVVRRVGDSTTPADVWSAAVRAVTARSESVHASMTEVVGEHTDFMVTGGWARSQGLLRAKEAAFGPLHLVDEPEAGARGAARFAGVAAGVQDLTHLGSQVEQV